MADETGVAEGSAAAADCVFCKVVAGEIPADVVREGELVLAFRDSSRRSRRRTSWSSRGGTTADVGALAAGQPDALAELVAAGGGGRQAKPGTTTTGWCSTPEPAPASRSSTCTATCSPDAT